MPRTSAESHAPTELPAVFADGAPRRLRPPSFASSSPTERITIVGLARVCWLVTVIVCAIAILILALQGYYGYAGVTLAVAISAAINLL